MTLKPRIENLRKEDPEPAQKKYVPPKLTATLSKVDLNK